MTSFRIQVFQSGRTSAVPLWRVGKNLEYALLLNVATERALGELSYPECVAVILRDRRGFEFGEIAEWQGRGYNVIRCRYLRAKAQLIASVYGNREAAPYREALRRASRHGGRA
jgi:DNA-directed RNA polymerase specialized sigma24 family protein